MSSTVNSVANSPEYEILRSKLYYGKFKYKISLTSHGLRFCRSMNTSIRDYKMGVVRSYYDNSIFPKGIEHTYLAHINCLTEIEKLKDKLFPEIMIRREYNSISLFLNDLEIVQNFSLPDIDVKTYQVYVGDQDPIIYFKNPPKFKYRAFLKGQINNYTVEQLINFISIYNDQIHINLPLSRIVDRRSYAAFLDTSTFDFNDKRLVTVLNLTIGNIVNKIYELRQFKNELIEV